MALTGQIPLQREFVCSKLGTNGAAMALTGQIGIGRSRDAKRSMKKSTLKRKMEVTGEVNFHN
jgi:hypothetical protein